MPAAVEKTTALPHSLSTSNPEPKTPPARNATVLIKYISWTQPKLTIPEKQALQARIQQHGALTLTLLTLHIPTARTRALGLTDAADYWSILIGSSILSLGGALFWWLTDKAGIHLSSNFTLADFFGVISVFAAVQAFYFGISGISAGLQHLSWLRRIQHSPLTDDNVGALTHFVQQWTTPTLPASSRYSKLSELAAHEGRLTAWLLQLQIATPRTRALGLDVAAARQHWQPLRRGILLLLIAGISMWACFIHLAPLAASSDNDVLLVPAVNLAQWGLLPVIGLFGLWRITRQLAGSALTSIIFLHRLRRPDNSTPSDHRP
jgi:hypothetical protein